jgi:hypothetical protein
VFAQRRYLPGEVIERAPVIVIPAGEVETINRSAASAYLYKWGADADQVAIALGYGSLYNHAPRANAH